MPTFEDFKQRDKEIDKLGTKFMSRLFMFFVFMSMVLSLVGSETTVVYIIITVYAMINICACVVYKKKIDKINEKCSQKN